MTISAKLVLPAAAATLLLLLPGQLRAQAPAGPIHPTRTDNDTHAPPPEAKKALPRHDLWGNWTLNLAKSDDPRKKMNPAGSSNRGGGPAWGGGYPGGRGGYPGGGHRDYGRPSEADRDRTHQLIDPANSLTLVHKDAEIDITDDDDRKSVLFTDGRKLQKSKDDKYKELAARWDASRLVTDEKGPNGMKITRSFEISPNGQQLYETLAVDPGVTAGFVLIRYIFDPVKQKPQPATATKPTSPEVKP